MVAIFDNGASSQSNAALLQHIYDLLVGERISRIFVLDKGLDGIFGGERTLEEDVEPADLLIR